MVTVLLDNRGRRVPAARVIDGELRVPRSVLREAGRLDAGPDDGDEVNVSALWRARGRPLLSDAAGETWALGASAAERATALESLAAPDFTLSDLDGRAHSLSDYRGRKVFLASWSSW